VVLTTKLLWGQLTDAIEKSKYPYLYFINQQYIDFIDNLEEFKDSPTLSRLYWADLVHTFDNSSMSDSMANISSGIEL
jgi:hypothetical protein